MTGLVFTNEGQQDGHGPLLEQHFNVPHGQPHKTTQHFLSHTHTEPSVEEPAEPERQIQLVTVTACMYANTDIHM